MTAVKLWSGIVLTMVLLGGLVGSALGQLLYHTSRNYVYVVGEWVSLGARAGFFSGTLAAAAAVVGQRHLPPIGPLFKYLVSGAGFIIASGLLAGIGGYLLSHAGILQMVDSIQWQVGNPNRVAFCLGLEHGVKVGCGIAFPGACVSIWRSRPTPDSTRA